MLHYNISSNYMSDHPNSGLYRPKPLLPQQVIAPMANSARVSPMSRQRVEDVVYCESEPTPSSTSDPGNNGSSRRRVPVACARCRKRKIRCTGDAIDGSGCAACKLAEQQHAQALGNCNEYDTVAMTQPSMNAMPSTANYPMALSSAADINASLVLLSTIGDLQSSAAMSRVPTNVNSQKISSRPPGISGTINNWRNTQTYQQAPAEYEHSGLALLATNAALQDSSTRKHFPDTQQYISCAEQVSCSTRPTQGSCTTSAQTDNYDTYNDENSYPMAYMLPSVNQDAYIPSAPYYPTIGQWTPTPQISSQANVRTHAIVPNGASCDPGCGFGASCSTATPYSQSFSSFSNMNFFPTSSTRLSGNTVSGMEAYSSFPAMLSLSSSLPTATIARNGQRLPLPSPNTRSSTSESAIRYSLLSTTSNALTFSARTSPSTGDSSYNVEHNPNRYRQYSRQGSANTSCDEAYQLSPPTQSHKGGYFPAFNGRTSSNSSTASLPTTSLSSHSARSNKGSISSSSSNTSISSRPESTTKESTSKNSDTAIAVSRTTTAGGKSVARTTPSHKEHENGTMSTQRTTTEVTSTALVLARKDPLHESSLSRFNTSSNLRPMSYSNSRL